MAARFLVVCPPRKVKRWTEKDIDPAAEQALTRLVDRLFDLQPEGEDPKPIGMTSDAKRVWLDYFNRHAQEQAELSGELAAAWSKLEETPARLALILHHVLWAANDPTLKHPEQVDGDTMVASVRLTEWFKYEARRVYSMLSESDEQRELRRLLDWVAGKGGRVTARDLQRGPRQYRGDTPAAEQALDDLAKAGYGCWQDISPKASGGRPTRQFVLNPDDGGDGDETPENAGEIEVVSPSPVSPGEDDGDDWGEV